MKDTGAILSGFRKKNLYDRHLLQTFEIAAVHILIPPLIVSVFKLAVLLSKQL